jgi:serine/threonine protein kinase
VTSTAGTTNLLRVYQELALAGQAPDIDAFCASHPEQPDLKHRLVAINNLRAEIHHLMHGTAGAPGSSPRVIGGFEVSSLLGRGGMGDVYVARQQSTGRLAALKFVRFFSPAIMERFLREGSLAAQITHSNIARVYACGVEEGAAYIATELVLGFSLDEVLEIARRLPPDAQFGGIQRAFAYLAHLGAVPTHIARQPTVALATHLASLVADALGYAHAREIVHRDVKPSNIMVDSEFNPMLIDFGIAVGLDDRNERATRTGLFIGSPQYAAPEQIKGDRNEIGPWTDVYGLGAVLYEMLTLHSPFGGVALDERLKDISAMPERMPRDIDPAVPSALNALIEKALETRPQRRFKDGTEMAAALREVNLVPTQRRSLRLRWPRWASRHKIQRNARRAAVILMAAASGGVVGLFIGANSARDQAMPQPVVTTPVETPAPPTLPKPAPRNRQPPPARVLVAGPKNTARLSGASASTATPNRGDRVEDEMVASVEKRWPQVRACYVSALQKTPELGGKLEVTWVVGLDGETTNVELFSSSLHDADLENCVLDCIRGWSFAPNTAREAIRIQYAWDFSPVRPTSP